MKDTQWDSHAEQISDEHSKQLKELKKPFLPEEVHWRPGALTKDETKALALIYADMRAYQERLDQVFGPQWGVEYQPWGENKIICSIWAHGFTTRASTGEYTPQQRDDNREIAQGPVAEAQAFKRACAAFGLGRYLYSMPQRWVAVENRTISRNSLGTLMREYREWYARVTGKAVASDEPPLEESYEVDEGHEVDFTGRADESYETEVHQWPDGEELLDILMHLYSSDVEFPTQVSNMIRFLRGLHQRSQYPMTENQYGYLSGLLDKRYEAVFGPGAHTYVLAVVYGTHIHGENRPGGMKGGKKEGNLLDWLANPDDNEYKLNVLDQLVDVIDRVIKELRDSES